MVKLMRPGRFIGWSVGAGILVASSLYGTLSHADSLKDGPAQKGPTLSGMTAPSGLSTMRVAEWRQAPVTSVAGENVLALRTIPTLSAQVAVGRTTFIPYLGAGFGGGYATEFDRSLHALPIASSGPGSTNTGLRDLFGPHLVPNEVQLGIRVPF